MASQALYRRWRSQTFGEVIGQEHITVTLRNALLEGRMSHAYLFAGPRGTGKTSTARILAKAINCLADDPAARPCNQCSICVAITEGRQLDLIEIDAASNRGIDEIRDLREKIAFRPNEARYRVYIIDEVHMLTKEAFNALLKTLEEPPPHAVFMLATTEPDRVPETVRSRCQRFDFKRISTPEIVERLRQIVESEGARAAPEALAAIARRATGSLRDAISLLDQLLSYGDDVLELARVEGVLGLVNAQTIGQLVDMMLAHDGAAGLKLLNRLVADGVDLGQLVDQIVAYLRAVLFASVARAPDAMDLPQDVVAVIMQQAEKASTGTLLTALREFMEARAALRDAVPGVPQLPIELAFLRSALPQMARAAAEAQVPAPSPGAAVVASPAAPAVGPGGPTGTRPATVPAPTGPRPSQAAPARQPDARPQRPVGQPSGAQAAPEADPGLLAAARASWDRFLAASGKRCSMKVQAALRSVQEIDVAGGTIILRFSHAFSRDMVGSPDNRPQVEALWSELLERKVQVKCVLMGESPAPASAQAPQPSRASSGGDEDPFLQEARGLGAVVKPLG